MEHSELKFNPCEDCKKRKSKPCATSKTYRCSWFEAEFSRVWAATVAYFLEVTKHVSEHP